MIMRQQIAAGTATGVCFVPRYDHSWFEGGPRMRKGNFVWPIGRVARVGRNEASRLFCTYYIPAFCMTLSFSAIQPASAECLKSPQQLLENKVSAKWRELRQKDNQPLFLAINAGPNNELHFVGTKPDGSTWISGAMSVCSYAENRYEVKLERIDQAPAFVGPQLTGKSATIQAGSSSLKFGTGRRCGNPDPCIEFTAE
jgi:hypothetical protein